MAGIYFPNAFTPNNAGKNDEFKAIVFQKLISFELRIYDRWGELIFMTNDYKKGWDGTIKGEPLNTSVFAWICSYQVESGVPAFQKGTVTLIK